MKTPTSRLRALPVALAAVLAAVPASAASMSADYERMAGWLSNEVVQGLSFNAGSTFDPPNEIRSWHVQPDISLGIGALPLNKGKFPVMETKQLADQHPEQVLPNSVTFPNLALHLRLGLPNRFDLTLRGANMTVPKGYKLAKGTTASGQSNSIGFGVRRHFFGQGGLPLLSVSGNFNHVKGLFNIQTAWQRLELTPGFYQDTRTLGRLEWNVNSFGLNAVMSQTTGIWTPFAGIGWNKMSGSMKTRLQQDFAGSLILPAIGEASDHPEEHQARLIVGTQLDRSRFSMFVNGELKVVGIQSGKAFILQIGFNAPFHIGSGSFASKGTKKTLYAKQDEDKAPWELDENERVYLHNAPKSFELPKRRAKRRPDTDPIYKPAKWDYRDAVKSEKRKRRKADLQEMIFIQ
ncbi:MAG: hypothetical protein HY925_07705 [Elusimicrobia bacterium]|nr:hypothetical protein [Elusimicrobiota bacterium]